MHKNQEHPRMKYSTGATAQSHTQPHTPLSISSSARCVRTCASHTVDLLRGKLYIQFARNYHAHVHVCARERAHGYCTHAGVRVRGLRWFVDDDGQARALRRTSTRSFITILTTIRNKNECARMCGASRPFAVLHYT